MSFKSEDDETFVGQTIERVFKERGNGFIAWLKNGRLSIDPDVLVQFLVPTSVTSQPNSEPHFQETNIRAPVSAAGYSYPPQHDKRNPPEWDVPIIQQPVTQVKPWYPPPVTGEPVMLRTLLRYGMISLSLEDIQLWDPAFKVPDHIIESLFYQYRNTPETGVKIVLGKNGVLQWSVDPKLVEISRSRNEGIQIAHNETLMLKTRIRNGQVSFEEGDVHFRHGNWQIPQDIIDSLKEDCGVLYIISNEKGSLRSIVKKGKNDRKPTSAKKRGR